MTAFAALQSYSNFSFLEGASHAQELVERAAELGLGALAVTDRNSLAGIVRAHETAKETGLRLIVGSRLDFDDGPSLLAYPRDRAAYGRLCRLLTRGRRRAPKGQCRLLAADLEELGEGSRLLVLPPRRLAADFPDRLRALKRRFGRDVGLAGDHLQRGDDAPRLRRLGDLADSLGLPLVAANPVLYHAPERRPLQDVLTCIREGCTLDEAGRRLAGNGEHYLKPAGEMARLFRRRADAVANAQGFVDPCRFSLDELRYDYPDVPGSEGLPPQQALEKATWAGAARRYPRGLPEKVAELLRHELALIGQLGYAPYFLTVEDIVAFARSQGILCQGRGSAANSVVCWCLGITAVDPEQVDVLFERFVSAERNEPPDIDIDFEHERREEVIQYVYARYGRDHAGLAATVIAYRPKSAIRDVGKALGLSLDLVDRLSKSLWGWGREALEPHHVAELGLDPRTPRLRLALALSRALIGFPRHLSQHVGGFVISRSPLEELVPIENAAMADRTVIQWDKDDLDSVRMLKIDLLALGMLSCIRRGFDLLRDHAGLPLTLQTVPREDPAVYDMLSKADSLGVFQVESRAQMTMLPRLKPRCYYDLVIEVAIVRPGPIQGDMVHPYLRRRNGEEKVDYPSAELRAVLEKTCGVPLFQEQAMRIAIVAGGFTPAQADRLRRAMATFRKTGTIHTFREQLVEGMAARGYDRDFAERCFRQIEGFGEYGFPESHAASFAHLVYVSAWLKCHHPAAFACALLNSQPMGFYAPAQIVRDAREHGVSVRPIDVNHSGWDSSLEPTETGSLALRLGLRMAKGCREADGRRLQAARGQGYDSLQAVWRRGGQTPAALEVLARADAFGSLGFDRRRALWEIRRLGEAPLPLFAAAEAREAAQAASAELPPEPPVALPALAPGEAVVEDYASVGLSLKAHPLALLRPFLTAERMVPAARLAETRDGARLSVAGLVLVRQRPGTASGVIFATLEDETGIANIVIWPKVFEAQRRVVLTSRLLGVTGRLQKEGLVIHLIADRLHDLSPLLSRLSEPQRQSFERAIARADEVRRPGADPAGRNPYAAMPEGRNFR